MEGIMKLAVVLSLTDKLTSPMGKVISTMNKATSSAHNLGKAMKDAGQSMKDSGAKMMDAAKGQIAGALAIGYGIAKPIKAAIDFESSMADVNKVVDFDTPEQFAEMKQGILEMSKVIPISVQGIASLVEAGGQANISRDELLGFAEDAGKMGVAFDIPAEAAGQMMAEWRSAFQMGQKEVLVLADQINHLGNTTAATAPKISAVVTRIGPLAKVAGVTEAQTAALGATLVGMGISEEVAATGLKNMMLALNQGEAATKRQCKAFDALGLDAVKMANLMQEDGQKGILVVLNALRQVPEAQRAAVMTQLFGRESVGAVAPLVNNIGALVTNLRAVADEAQYAGSMEKEFAARSATTANEIQLLKNKISIAAITLGDSFLPLLNEALVPIGKVVERFAEWAKANPELIASIGKLLAGFIVFKGTLAGGKFLFGWLLSGVGGFIKKGGGLLSFLDDTSTYFKVLKAEGGGVFSSLVKAFGETTGLRKVAIPVKFVASGLKKRTGKLFGGIFGVGKFVFGNAASGIRDLSSAMSNGVKNAARFAAATGKDAVTAVKSLGGKLASGASRAATFTASMGGKAISGIKSFGTALFTKAIPAAWSFTAALLANPMTWVVVGIVVLVGALIWLARNWDKVKDASQRFIIFVGERIAGPINAIRQGFGDALDWVIDKYEGAKIKIGEWVTGVVSWFFGIPDSISESLSGVWEAITGPFGKAISTVEGWWNSLKSTFGGGVKTTVEIEEKVKNWTPGSGTALEKATEFALGGHVTGPTFALIGEAGNEWVIPEDGNKQRSLSLLFGAAAALGVPLVPPVSMQMAEVSAGTGVPSPKPFKMPWETRGKEPKHTAREERFTGTERSGKKSDRPITFSGPVHITVPGAATPEKFIEMLARGLRRHADAHGEVSC